MTKAPATIHLKVCPECGRDDRFRPFTGKRHFWRGYVCTGTPQVVVYVPKETR